MSKTRVLVHVSAGLAVLAMSGWRVAPARAGVVALRNLVGQDPSLVHQWTFEGGSPLADSAGSSNLHQVGSNATILPAFAGQGNAMRGFGSGGLRSIAFTPPTAGTVEYLFRPEVSGGHIVSLYSGGNRLYFGLNDGSPGAAVGFGNGGWPTPRAEYLTGSTTPNYQTGHWYYVGVVYDKATTPTQIGFDVYVADLTEGQTTLTHAIAAGTKPAAGGGFGPATLGIGMQGNVTGGYYTGFSDEVAFYGSQLSRATLQSHLDALMHPEPLGATLDAVEDTYVNVDGSAADRALNHGSEELIRVGIDGPGGTGTKEGLVKFDLSGLPGGLRITGATLQGIQTDGAIGAGFDVFAVTSDWDELTVTGAAAPSVGDDLGLMRVNLASTLGGFSAFSSSELLDLVQAWYLGQTPNFGLSLKTHVGTHGDTLASRENTGGHLPPQLVLEYAVPEPSACVLLGLGGLALVLGPRWRKRGTVCRGASAS